MDNADTNTENRPDRWGRNWDAKSSIPAAIEARSGLVSLEDPLSVFLYFCIMQGNLSPDQIENIIRFVPTNQPFNCENGWVAKYAADVSNRLKPLA